MALTGTLSTLSLPNLIQLHCSSPQTAVVRLMRRGRIGALAFADTELVHASVGTLNGEDALYELLSWEEGDFHVDDTATDIPVQNIDTPWSMLLLDMLHRIDEERAERDSAASQVLAECRAHGQVRSAVVVDRSGKLRALATDGEPERAAALVALVTERMHALGEALQIGNLGRVVLSRQNERIWLENLGDSFLGCWLPERGSPDQLKAVLEKLKDNSIKTG